VGNPQHFTLTAGTVKVFTLDADFGEIEVTNVDGTALVYFTTDGSAPAVGADGSNVVTAGPGAFLSVRPRTSGNTVVKVISSGTPKVSVRGITE
jgi:hypothetical protein